MNEYAGHLATVNETQEVVASEDICNAQGQILVKKGGALNVEMAERMARFKLQKPLEDSILIENELNSETLLQRFEEYIAKDPQIARLHKKFYSSIALKDCCDLFRNLPILRQKLTVLSLILPDVFDQAMFCAWLGSLLSSVSGERIGSAKNTFLAGMCHDIGMVHISAEILTKKEDLTLDEWKQIHAHPVIGYNIVKDSKGMDESVARAILEHHENLDGTGYPRATIGTKLASEGQLLNLLDSVNAIYTKYFKPFNRSLSNLIPIIQMNQQSRFGLSANQLIILLRETPAQPTCDFPDHLVGDVIAFAKKRGEYIIRCAAICAEVANHVGFRHDDAQLASIQNGIIHITMSITSSGIINEAYLRWLDQVAKEQLKHAYAELEEAFLIMREVIYHVDRLKRQIQVYLQRPEKAEFRDELATGLHNLEGITLPPVPSKLALIWLFKG